MKVVLVNADYGFGSTGKITELLHQSFREQGIESYVIYGRESGCTDDATYSCISSSSSRINHVLALTSGDLYGWCYASTNRIIRQIQQLKPDIVHLECLYGFFVNIPLLLKWLAKNRIKTVLTLHAEFMYTGGCENAADCLLWQTGCNKCERKITSHGFRFVNRSHAVFQSMKAAFDSFNTQDLYIISVSGWIAERAKKSPVVSRFKNQVIFNPLNTDVFHFKDKGREKEILVGDSKMIFFPTASFFPENLTDNKGGHYIVDLARRFNDDDIPVKIVVAASYGSFSSLPDNIVYIGRVGNQVEMSKYYAMADVTISVSKRESFGMTVIESLCCGTPVVGFEAGGPETITSSEFASFVNYGDADGLYESVLRYIDGNASVSKETKSQISANARAMYSRKAITDEHIRLYKEILE